jgi:hypothetical protein
MIIKSNIIFLEWSVGSVLKVVVGNWEVVGFGLHTLTATNFVTQKQRYNFPLPQATPCNILSVRSF